MSTRINIIEFVEKAKADLDKFKEFEVKNNLGHFHKEDDWFGLFADFMIDEEMAKCQTTSSE